MDEDTAAVGSMSDSVENSLDPDNWQDFKALGHRMLDDMMSHLETVRERPVWTSIATDFCEHFQDPLPEDPQGALQAYEDFLTEIIPHHPALNIHPRFWGWVIGTGSPLGVLAEMLTAALNANVGGGNQIPVHVEVQVLDWCKEMLGYPKEASGVLVSGCSMANMIGLAVARNTKAGFDVRREGLQAAPQRMMFYTSTEAHSSIGRALSILGLGAGSLREVPTDADFRIDIPALEAMISDDRARGHRPVCVIGNAGTVNTGAFDDLERLATVCAREDTWLHVDGAFGAFAALSPKLRHLVAGMELADSLALDFHKWMHVPYEAGCVLVRSREDHVRTFSMNADYIHHTEPWFSDYGPQLSRSFRALKIWLSLKAHGVGTYRGLVQQNVDLARYLEQHIRANPRLELLAPVVLNIVCFRHLDPRPGPVDPQELERCNRVLLMRMQGGGQVFLSDTLINGVFALRVSITNHRTRRADLDFLIEHMLTVGERVFRSPRVEAEP
jgi:aromatic-L-amino-acid decarboxylase